MLRFVVAGGCALVMAGCAIDPSMTGGKSRKPYQALASCVAASIDVAGLSKLDLPTERTVKLSLSDTGVRMWEVSFIGTSDGGTEWRINRENTLLGAGSGVVPQVVPAIKACEER